MAASALVISPVMVRCSSHNALPVIIVIYNTLGSLLVSCGYDMQVNVWNMNNYQLKNSYKVTYILWLHLDDNIFFATGT